MVDRFKEFYAEADLEVFELPGFDEAVIGIEEHELRLVYSRKKIIKILMKQNKWDEIEAREFFAYNMFGAYVGDHTPIFCLDDI